MNNIIPNFLFTVEAHTQGAHFYLVYRPVKEDKSKGVVVLLHGFPGWVTKNYDLAELLTLEGYICYVPHYPGLGLSVDEGPFDFLDCISSIESFYDFVSLKHKDCDINLIGHSWGGYLALRLAERCTGKMIILAPLAVFPRNKVLENTIKGLLSEAREDCSQYDYATLLKSFQRLASDIDYEVVRNFVERKGITVFKALNDEVITTDLLDEFDAIVNHENLQIYSLDDDHLFSKRRALHRNLIKVVQGWGDGQKC